MRGRLRGAHDDGVGDRAEPGAIRLTSRLGSVVVTGEDRSDVHVEGGADRIVSTSDGLVIESGRGALVVRCPVNTDVLVGAGSGSVSLHGTLGAASVTLARGSVTIDHAREVDARTRLGSVEVGTCDGACRAQSGNGRLRIDRARSVELAAERGSVKVGAAGASRVRVGRGSITLGLSEAAAVELETHSGSITVTVPHGLRPALSLQSQRGSVHSDVASGGDGEIRATTRRGQIAVTER